MALVVDIGVHARAGIARIDVSVDEVQAGLYATVWQHSIEITIAEPDDASQPQAWLLDVLRPLVVHLGGDVIESEALDDEPAAADPLRVMLFADDDQEEPTTPIS